MILKEGYMAKIKLKERKPWWRTALNAAGYMFVIIALAFVVFVQFNQNKNQLFSIFGYSIAVIQSGSMMPRFEVGERVVIRSCNTDNLRKNDIIVFYKYIDNCDKTIHFENITESVETYEKPVLDEIPDIFNQRTSVNIIMGDSNIKLVFHRIMEIWVDDYGVRFFETQGDHNSSSDGKMREDYVAGQYIEISETAKSVLNFVSSPTGLFIIVLIPISILTLLQIKYFAAEMFGVILSKRLIKRKIRYDNKDLKDIEVSKFLSDPEKLYLYDITLKAEKENIKNLLWGDLDDEKLTIQQKIIASSLKKSFILYKDDREKYWDYWIDKEKSNFIKKQLQIARIQANLVLKEGVSDEEAPKKALKIYKELNSNGTENKDAK